MLTLDQKFFKQIMQIENWINFFLKDYLIIDNPSKKLSSPKIFELHVVRHSNQKLQGIHLKQYFLTKNSSST